MSNLSHIYDQGLYRALANACLRKAVLAINAGGAASVRTTNVLEYTVDGVLYTRAALSNQSIAVTHRADGRPVSAVNPQYVQPINTTVIYVLAVNAAGGLAVIQGSFEGQVLTDAADLSRNVLQGGGMPELPAGFTPFGAIRVVTNNSATFTPGTTALDAAGLTVTYFDLCLLPRSL